MPVAGKQTKRPLPDRIQNALAKYNICTWNCPYYNKGALIFRNKKWNKLNILVIRFPHISFNLHIFPGRIKKQLMHMIPQAQIIRRRRGYPIRCKLGRIPKLGYGGRHILFRNRSHNNLLYGVRYNQLKPLGQPLRYKFNQQGFHSFHLIRWIILIRIRIICGRDSIRVLAIQLL